ncbi:hypothetical protein QM012_008217 [Aureobasidium pullulans]|uniref:Wax synthase domain-containing protein n=1 Tax=Aureobasidium pullulans TaxID=5580 RepID=A0ABR0TKD5_AURPU
MDSSTTHAAPPILPSTSTTNMPGYTIPLLQLLFGASALSRSTTLNLFALALGSYWLCFLGIHHPQGPWTRVYTMGCTLISVFLKTLSSRWLMSENEFQRRGKDKNDDGDDGKKEGKSSKKSWKQWVFDVIEIGFGSARGIGWNFQIRNVPPAPSPTTPRLQFAAKQLVSAAINLLLVDLSYWHLRHFSSVTAEPIAPLTSQPLPLALFNAWLIYIQAYWVMSALFSVVAAITVPLHIYPPSAFPPLFGSFAHAYTMKRFWAHTWHQMMRSIQLPYTAFLVRKLNLDERKKSTYWVKVCVAFFFAWLVHAYGTLISGGGLTCDFWRYAPQVLAFWVEEKVIEVGKKMGCKGRKWRVLGYLWVFVFNGCTLLAWFAPPAAQRAYIKHPLGFSVVDKIMK